MDGLSLDPSHWWRDHRLTKCPMPMPQLLTSRSPPNYTFLWLRFMGTYISRGVCTQQVLTNGFLYFTEFRKFPKYVTSTWVLKTRLIEKKTPIIFFQAKFSEIARRFQKCKSQNREQRASKVRALFLTFPHEKNTFQWSKVVSEAIFPTN